MNEKDRKKNNLILSCPFTQRNIYKNILNSTALPFSSLLSVLQGLKARNFIHSKIEENIKKKLQESDKESKHRDALQQLIDSSSRNGEQLSMQVLDGSSFPTCENDFSCPGERRRDGGVFLVSPGHQGVGNGASVRRP